MQVTSDSNTNASASRVEEKVGEGKHPSHTLDEVVKMVRSTISVYEKKVTFSLTLFCILSLAHEP